MVPGVLATALRVARKELASSLRDQQTLIYAVVLPLVLYPVIFWVMIQARSFLVGRDEATTVEVALFAEDDVLAARLTAGLSGEPAEDAELEPGTIAVTRLPGEKGAPDAEAAAELLEADAGPDAVLVVAAGGPSRSADPNDEPGGATLYHLGTASDSRLALDRVRGRVRLLIEDLRAEAVRAAGGTPEALAPFALETRNLASSRDLSAYLFSLILPLTFVLMSVLGAFYPAVDCTAGEKERGTEDTTLLIPAPRLGVQLGKILAVAAAALVATVLNLLGLVLAAEPLLAALGDRLTVDVPWTTLAAVLPVCGAFLFTVSSILVAVASFTDTFKQGQSLLGTVQLLFLLPAMVAVMPGVELTPGLALVPVVQTVLAFKAILAGSDGAGALGLSLVLVFASQLAYAGLAVWVSVRLSSREALHASGVSLGRVLQLWRSEGTPR